MLVTAWVASAVAQMLKGMKDWELRTLIDRYAGDIPASVK